MTPRHREVMQQAEAVLRGCLEHPDAEDALAALRAALTEPQEPVAHAVVRPLQPDEYECRVTVKWVNQPITGPLYTAPQPKAEPEPAAVKAAWLAGYTEGQKDAWAEQPAEQEPVIGTKTWFEDGKLVTQNLTAADIYKAEQEPVAWAMRRPDGLILDVICPEEHAREPGQYTVPLYERPQPKAEPDHKDRLIEQLEETNLWQAKRISELLAEPQSAQHGEPAAWMCSNPALKGYNQFSPRCEGDWNIPVYTAPPAPEVHKPRKRLTDEEIDDLWELWLTTKHGAVTKAEGRIFGRAIEAAVWGDAR